MRKFMVLKLVSSLIDGVCYRWQVSHVLKKFCLIRHEKSLVRAWNHEMGYRVGSHLCRRINRERSVGAIVAHRGLAEAMQKLETWPMGCGDIQDSEARYIQNLRHFVLSFSFRISRVRVRSLAVIGREA